MARGCIYSQKRKRAGRTYYIKYRTGDGTQVKKAIGPNRGEAQRALNAALAEVDRGEQRTTSRDTFAQAADQWLASKRPRIEHSTYRGYEIEPTPAAEARLRPAEAAPDHPRPDRGLPGRARRRRQAQPKDDQRLADPAATDPRPRGPRRRHRHQPGRELRPRRPLGAPLRAPDDALPDPRAGASLPRGLQALVPAPGRGPDRAGLRIGEAIALEWRDVDWDGSALNVTRAAKDGGIGTPKGDRGRTVVIAPYLLELLRDHLMAD